MAVLVYSNGITEYYKPANLVFTEDELVRLFEEYPAVKTIRLTKILNTWCIVGDMRAEESEFNKIVSDVVGESVFSHAVFVHDSEINPEWNTTDTILYANYEDFLKKLKMAIETAAEKILNELESVIEQTDSLDKMPQLKNVGITDEFPKRLLFTYNPEDQTKKIYTSDEFDNFSRKVYDYIIHNKQHKGPFRIYEDSKAVIVIEAKKAKEFLMTLIDKFQSKEEYEICTNITKIMNEWVKEGEQTQTSKPRARRKKSNE